MKNNRWKPRNCMKLWQGVSSPRRNLLLDLLHLPMSEKKATSLTEAEAEGRTGDMHRRSVIYAPGGIIGVHISLKITGGCQCREPMWCSRSFTSPPAPSMVTRNVILNSLSLSF